jgi:rRNA maturation endonuclease Nob1
MSFGIKCQECEEEFEAKTMFARYCGARCRMRAYRKTDKGKAAYTKYNERYKRV